VPVALAFAQETGLGDCKYKAFISYSHADEHWGAWLQRSLERFRAPAELARRLGDGERPLRLTPVFRDREDLPVAGSLNDAIRQALGDSEFQIVLCSPNAARSRWVNEEIKLFHRLHGPGRTFAIMVAGEPGAGEQECFPPALRYKLDANGDPTAEAAEPLAADAREGGDGKRYALLKTAAGMLGVGLDDLVRRDARARARKMRAIIAGTSAIAASMTFAAVFAFQQRDEARTMRGKAETLVEFMLSDLSDRLEPVGKLDILEAVGSEVLNYYADQDLKSLDPAALSRRAQALTKLGQVDERRGDLDAALKAYDAAFASTEEQLKRSPGEPDRIFDHAQSVFYLGNISVIRGDYERAEMRLQQYFDYAIELMEIAPEEPRSQLEIAFATNSLGALAYNRGQYATSVPFFEQSVEARRQLAAANPGDRIIAFALASALSWFALANNANGDYPIALSALREEVGIYDTLDAAFLDPDYYSLEKRITAERRISSAHLALGETSEARAALERGAKIGEMLILREPKNLNSQTNVGITERLRSYLSGLEGNFTRGISYADRALRVARAVASSEPTNATSKINLGYALVQRVLIEPVSSESEVRDLEALLQDPLVMAAGDDLEFMASASLARAKWARIIGRHEEGKAIAMAAVVSLSGRARELTAESRRALALLSEAVGDREGASKICDGLYEKGVRHPELMALRGRLIAQEMETRVSSSQRQ